MIPGLGANIALYFFLAGSGAGMFIVSWVMRRLGRLPLPFECRPLDVALLVAPIALVAGGAFFLFADLGVPANAHLVLLRPLKSTISFGAWSVLVFLAIDSLNELSRRLHVGLPSPVSSALDWLSLVSAVSVALYTGVYLFRTYTVPFWHTPAVIFLFAAGSLTCGSALLSLAVFFTMPRSRSPLRTLSKAGNALVSFEIASLAWFCASRALAGGKSLELLGELLAGGHAPMFWLLVVGLGILVPTFLRAFSSRTQTVSLYIAAAFCTLVGGLALRCSIILF